MSHWQQPPLSVILPSMSKAHWAFSPLCWLEPRSALERFPPQQIFQNPAVYPNSNLKSYSSQAGKAPREHRSHDQVRPPASLSFPTQKTRSTHTQSDKTHFEPTSALSSGVMHILIPFLSFIFNLIITLEEENTQP